MFTAFFITSPSGKTASKDRFDPPRDRETPFGVRFDLSRDRETPSGVGFDLSRRDTTIKKAGRGFSGRVDFYFEFYFNYPYYFSLF
jgi:hypothetical protein